MTPPSPKTRAPAVVRILRSRAPAMWMLSELVAHARVGQPVIELNARSGGRTAPPPVVVWNVCRRCNMSCPSCTASGASRRSARELETAEVCAGLAELAAAGVRCVVWSGGEPLLRDDLPVLVSRTRQLGMRAELSSNGALLAARVRPLADAGLSLAEACLHAPGRRNDAYRGVPGSFELAMRGLAAARGLGIPIGLRVTLTRATAAEIGPMVDLAVQHSVNRLHVARPACLGRTRRMPADELSPEESRIVLLRLLDRVAALEGAGPVVTAEGFMAAGPVLVRWAAERWGVAAADRAQAALRRRAEAPVHGGVVTIDHLGRGRAGGEEADLRKGTLADLVSPAVTAAARVAGEGR